MTCVCASLAFSGHRQKREEIALGDPHHAAETVRSEMALCDPSPDRAVGDVELLCNLRDREELDFVAPITATLRPVRRSCHGLIADAERPNSRVHRPPPSSDRAAMNSSSASMATNRLRPILRVLSFS